MTARNTRWIALLLAVAGITWMAWPRATRDAGAERVDEPGAHPAPIELVGTRKLMDQGTSTDRERRGPPRRRAAQRARRLTGRVDGLTPEERGALRVHVEILDARGHAPRPDDALPAGVGPSFGFEVDVAALVDHEDAHRLHVYATHPHYHTAHAVVNVPGRMGSEPVVLRMDVATLIEGDVVDPHGHPVENARVVALHLDRDSDMGMITNGMREPSTRTDAHGGFVMRVDASGAYVLCAYDADHAHATTMVDAREGQRVQARSIRLRRGVTVRGTTSLLGKETAFMPVTLERAEGAGGSRTQSLDGWIDQSRTFELTAQTVRCSRHTTTSDDSGSYVIRGVTEGSWIAHTGPPTREIVPRPNLDEPGVFDVVHPACCHRARVAIRTTDEIVDLTVDGALVRLTLDGIGEGLVGNIIVHIEDSTSTVYGRDASVLWPAKQALKFGGTAYQRLAGTRTVVVPDRGQTMHGQLRLSPVDIRKLGSLELRITDGAGDPIRAVRASIAHVDAPQLERAAHAFFVDLKDEEGVYRQDGLPPGRVRYTISRNDGTNSRSKTGEVSIESRKTTRVDVRFATHATKPEGRIALVVRTPDGRVVPATVSLRTKHQSSVPVSFSGICPARSGPIESGQYILTATFERGSVESTVEVRDGQTTDVSLMLDR